MSGRYQEGYVNGCRKTREELTPEIDRLRAALQAYLDYCAPEDKWQGDPVLLRIRRQMRAALGDEQKVTGFGFDPEKGREFPCDKDGNEVR